MGLLKGSIEDYSSPLAGVPARLYTGYFFVRYGLEKLGSGFDGEALRQTLTEWSGRTPYDIYLPFLQTVAIPYAGIFAILVILGELAVGTALLVGAATRLAAVGGLFLSLNFLLASGAPLLSVEEPVVFTILLLTIYATAPGRTLACPATDVRI